MKPTQLLLTILSLTHAGNFYAMNNESIPAGATVLPIPVRQIDRKVLAEKIHQLNLEANWTKRKKLLIDVIENFSTKPNEISIWWSPLEQALEQDDITFATYLIEKGADLTKQYENSDNPMSKTSSAGLTRLIIQKGVNVTQAFKNTKALEANPRLAFLYYKYGAKVDLQWGNFFGNSNLRSNALYETMMPNFKGLELTAKPKNLDNRVQLFKNLVTLQASYSDQHTSIFKNLDETAQQKFETARREAYEENAPTRKVRRDRLPALLQPYFTNNNMGNLILTYDDPHEHIIPFEIIHEVDAQADRELAALTSAVRQEKDLILRQLEYEQSLPKAPIVVQKDKSSCIIQ